MKRRYEIILDGAGGLSAVDLLERKERYIQIPGLDDVALTYEGVRQLVPYVYNGGSSPNRYSTLAALKAVEFANKVVLIGVAKSLRLESHVKRELKEFDDLVQTRLSGWRLLSFDIPFAAIDEFSFFEAALRALCLFSAAFLENNDQSAEWLSAVIKNPYVDDGLLREINDRVELHYAARDYAVRKKASFIQYYGHNSAGDVLLRAKEIARAMISGGDLADRLRDAITNSRPFSFVRVGEGEGCFISYSRYIEDRSPANEVFGICAKDIYRIWFNRSIHDAAPSEIGILTKNFRTALLTADVVGVPSPERVLFEYGHFVEEISSLGYSRGYVGVSEILLYVQDMRDAGLLGNVDFVDCDIARPLYEWQAWEDSLAATLPRLIEGERDVVLVTCHPHLGPALESMLDLHSLRVVLIPPEKGRVNGEGCLDDDHYHAYFERVCQCLREGVGRIVLVAAGFLGKFYCSVAREAGAVAIDIGSLADYWVGANTRRKDVWNIPSPFAVR